MPAHASNVVVPDGAPTIQEAIDLGPDTVLVRAGTYLEAPILHGEVTLLGLSEGDIRPSLSGLSIVPTQYTTGYLHFTVRKLDFTGQVVIDNDNILSMITFAECGLAGGIGDYSAFPATVLIALHGCKVSNRAFLKADGDCVIDSCEFNTQLIVAEQNCHLFIDHSQFHGDGRGYGISTVGGGSDVASATISNTLIENCRSTGLVMSAIYAVHLDSLVIRDCIGWGIYARGDDVSISHCQVDRCGDFGIHAEGIETLQVLSNVVRDCRGSEAGILAIANYDAAVAGNIVTGCRSDGIHLGANPASQRLLVTNNSSCLNGGAGFLSECTINFGGRFDFVGNVGYGNSGFGIRWGLPDVTAVSCNDWFENGLGNVSGLPPSALDQFIDPLFCDAANGDFHLSGVSPLVNAPACGRVGALDVGCTAPGVQGSAFRLARVGPNPAAGAVTIEFEMPQPAAIDLEVFDLLGRRVASPARGGWPAGRHSVVWTPPSGSAGVYLVRYRHPGGEDLRRIAIVR